MKSSFWKGFLHALVGGVSVALASYSGGAITLKSLGLPAAISAITSVFTYIATRQSNQVPTQPSK